MNIKTIHRHTALLAILCMAVAMLAGCGNTSASSDAASAPAVSEIVSEAPEQAAASSSEVAASVEDTESVVEVASEAEEIPEVQPLEADENGMVTITDMAGRTVTFPENPMVWNSSPTCEGWLCAIAPEQIIGFAAEFTPEQLAYYPAAVADTPVIGGNFGNNEANTEGILAVSPDVIINTYDVSEAALETSIATADAMAEQYGIPVIVVSRDIADTAKAAGLLGLWLGQPQRGAEVEAYLQTILDEIQDTIDAVPEDQVVTYYYAEGTDGLSTEAADSFHADVYRYLGLKPAVGEDVAMSNFGGMEAVSLEQVLQWNPEYIFVWNAAAYQEITTSGNWDSITAVQNGNVYLNPSLPQNWVDRSPNALRILGCLYTAAKCYPEQCTYDLSSEVQKFFRFMYDVELTPEQLSAVCD